MNSIKVNTLCKINQENPTPVKEQLIALNVTAVDAKSDFQNFVLGIDDFQSCCEYYGTFSNDIPEQLFVKQIIPHIGLSEEQAKKILPDDVSRDDVDAYALVNKNDEAYLFGVFNVHNGYYAHAIYENGKEIDYL